MIQELPLPRIGEILSDYALCSMCPRNCKVNRINNETGICGSPASVSISSVCMHHGEEPVISGSTGICNVFFNRCNLQCIYCQNHQISRNTGEVTSKYELLYEVVTEIAGMLDSGCHAVGFVSPTHFIPHVKAIVEILRFNGYNPVFVYNTNGYDKVDEIRGLENYIDVYLPDYKYSDNRLALQYSKAADYQQYAIEAIKEMYRQKGSTLIMSEQGLLEKGLIVRHLVLPGNIDNSIKALHQLADISTSIAVSLMAQYYPTEKVDGHPLLGRKVTAKEYSRVTDELEALGFYKGWIQELESSENYIPDFELDKPFN